MRSLSFVDCSSVSEASDLFATETGLLVLWPHQRCKASIWFTIPSGCYALVTSHGKQLDYVDENGKTPIWPAGLHFPYAPSVGVSCLVTKRDTLLEISVDGCKTEDNVKVDVDVIITFRIMGDAKSGEDPYLVRRFVDEVRPSELENKLRCAQEEAVRAEIVKVKAHDVCSLWGGDMDELLEGSLAWNVEEQHSFYHSNEDSKETLSRLPDDENPKTMKRRKITDGMRMRLNEEFTPLGVEIQSVMIKCIHLPSDIKSQINDKTKSAYGGQPIHDERAGQKSKMKQEVRTMRQSFLADATFQTQVGFEMMNAERVTLDKVMAEAGRIEANRRESSRGEIGIKLAQNKAEINRVNDRKAATIENIRTKTAMNTAELLANSKLHHQSELARAFLTATKKDTESMQILSMAEGKIGPWLEKKHEFKTRMQGTNVAQGFVDSEDILGEALNPMSPTAVEAFVSGISTNDDSRRRILSELGITGKCAGDILKS